MNKSSFPRKSHKCDRYCSGAIYRTFKERKLFLGLGYRKPNHYPLACKKKKEALTKVNSFRENFKKRETNVQADLEKAGRILKELGERFRWWQKQELP